MLQGIRAFFAERNVLEVETPVITPAAITDPQIASFQIENIQVESFSAQNHSQYQQRNYYLQTSPEYYMKRLLAAGSGDIFQLAKVFRDDENGRYHNPEFSMLEWYRVGFDHHQLMDEMQSLISCLMPEEKILFQRISYQQAFIKTLQIDPFDADVNALKQCAKKHNIETPQGMDNDRGMDNDKGMDSDRGMDDDKDIWLDWLMVEKIAAGFAKNSFTFLYDYPASQASLARLDKDDSRKANRFELFYGELELANGFYELTDASEQAQRFENDNEIRRQRQQKTMPVDYALLAALQSGLPDCSGVAIGIDRLLMLLTGAGHIKEVISFGDEFER